MPAREQLQASETEATPVEVVPAIAPEIPKTEFSADGDLPAVAETATTPAGATASELAYEQPMQPAKDLDRGVYHWEDYKAACDAAGRPDKSQDRYQAGHTDADGWDQPYEQHKVLNWALQKNTSASKALIEWKNGTTIADYMCAGVAEELDELRDELGDAKFDSLFGSADAAEDAKIPESHRLRIWQGAYGIPLVDQMKQIAREADAPEQQPVEHARAQVETRVEDKPRITPLEDQEPAVIAEELGLDRQVV